MACASDENPSGANTMYVTVTMVMNSAGENGAEYYPEESGRPEHNAHDGAEYGPQTRDIQELDQKYFPGGELYIVHAVGHGMDRCVTCRVLTEHLAYEHAVSEVSGNEDQKRD